MRVFPVIIVGGFNSTGSSSLAQKLSSSLNLRYIYAGQLMRELCVRLGYCKPEEVNTPQFDRIYKRFGELLKQDPKLNKQLDDYILKTIKEAKTPTCVEGRITAALVTIHNIPVVLRIWITASIEDRIARFKIKHPNNQLSDEEIKQLLLARDRSEIQQYRAQYGIDLSKPNLYNDIVLDTSGLDIDESFVKLTTHPIFQKRLPLLEEWSPDFEHVFRYRCEVCQHLYESYEPISTCPRCGNNDINKIQELEY